MTRLGETPSTRSRFVNFWFALYIPTALDKISWASYIIFAAICFATAVSTWLFQVETANRSLEEMDTMFEGHSKFPFLDKDLTRVHPRRDDAREERLREMGHGSADGKQQDVDMKGSLKDDASKIEIV